jgi:hypothetical protein
MNPDKFNFFEFLTSLDQVQLEKYFLMLGPDESEYVRHVVREVGTELNMLIAETMDEVEDLADAKYYLNGFTLSGKAK